LGVVFEGAGAPICFNARYNTDADFDPGLTKKQQHTIDIDPRRELYVNIDLKQMGVAGDDSWGARALPQYRMRDDKYEYSYVIRAVQK
jgi:beta-galactosidase